MKKYFPIIIVFGAILFAAFGLFTPRFIPTHDGEYHIIRFWQFYKMLSVGDVFPRWAPDLNSGYGLPLFNYHYPFPNYVAAFFHLFGVGFVDAFKLTVALGYMLAVLWCFLWIRSMRNAYVAASSAIIFAFVPYWFVDIYVRGSVGEVWGISFVLLTHVAIERRMRVLTALGTAGLIISHNITALFCLPLLCVYVLFRNRKHLVSIGQGIVLASYFWIPAFFESTYMVGLNSVNFIDHFADLYQLLVPSWGTGFSGRSVRFDQMSYQIGIVPIGIFLLSIVVWIIGKAKDRTLAVSLLIWSGVFYCMTVGSLWLWELIPIIQYIQYPWRLLTLLLLLTPWLFALVAEKIPKWMSLTLVLLAIFVTMGYVRPVTYERRADNHYIKDPNFTDGTSSLGNSFATKWSGWKRTRFKNRFEFNPPNVHVSYAVELPNYYKLFTRMETDVDMRANILYFPGWRVLADKKLLDITYEQDGVIHAAIPKGTKQIEVVFGQTPLRRVAEALSIVGLFWVFGSGILGGVYAHSVKQLSTSDGSQGARRGNIHNRTHRSLRKRAKHHSHNV